jgi:hypothetical protein
LLDNHLPYGTTWLSRRTFGSYLPNSSHTVMWLPYGARGSYVAHAAAIWCMQLPYGALCSHIAHMAPICPSHATCSFHMVPHASHMVPSTSNMHTQHTQLPYGPHMMPSSSHMVYRLPYGPCGSHTANVAPIWCYPLHMTPMACTQLPYRALCLP